MFPSQRKTAPRVVGGRTLRKNNHEPTRGLVDPQRAELIVARERPGRGYRHVVSQRDVHAFVAMIPDWESLRVGLSAIVLAAGNPYIDGRHRPGIIELCAWDAELVREIEVSHYTEHREVLELLAVPCEQLEEEFVVCHFDERSARAFMLMHVLLHELGHHHDRMTTRSRSESERGEAFAERFARDYEARMWARFARELA